MEKGFMIPGKQYLGWVLIALAVIYILKDIGNMAQLVSIIEPYKIAVWMLIAVAGYFLIISGRRY